MSIIHLSDEQKQQLLHLANSAPELIIHRARLILAYSTGKPTLQAANEAGISRGRARYWKRQFFAKGMEIFELASPGDNQDLEVVGEAEKKDQEGPLQAPLNEREQQPAVQVSIPYPTPIKSIGIRADDSLADAGRKVWLYNFALMLSHEEGTILGKEIEKLHDMRVATRRMRTGFDVFGAAFEPKIMKRFRSGLRSIGRALGAVRDMDVILESALCYQSGLDEGKQDDLEPLIAAWKRSVEKKRSKMAEHLQSEAYLNFKYNFNLFLQAPDQAKAAVENLVMNPKLRDIVPVLVYGRYAAVRAYEMTLPTASFAQLHALRIEFKKFRYVLEYFREILGENVSHSISEIKRIQDHLGELHDTDVACQLVADFLEDWEHEQLSRPIYTRQNPEQIVTYLAYLHSERYRLTSTFPQLWNQFSRPEFRQQIANSISGL